MNEFTVAAIDGWDARPLSGGLEELRALCASSFTGVVRLDGADAENPATPDRSAGSNDDTGATERGAAAALSESDEGRTDEYRSGDAAGDDAAATGDSDGTERGDVDAGGETDPERPWLAMVDGDVRGVFEGTIADFSDGAGTAYAASARSLVLLCAMTERADGERGDLHTDEHLSVVEADLPEDFAGYIELIGNGLDGAYYVVYDEGRVSTVVSEEHGERVARTDPEGFDRAAEHTSVYEVRAVPLDPVPVPEPDPDPPTEPNSAIDSDPAVSLDPDDRHDSTDGSADGGAPSPDESDADGATVAELRAERDRLRADVTRLETALDAYRSGTSRGAVVDADGGTDTDEQGYSDRFDHRSGRDEDDSPLTDASAPETETQRDPDEALSGTTLLVRYGSQGAPTLARASEDTDPEAVRANLRITPHTDFDAAGTVVAGTAFDDFLRSSIEYRFVEWVLGRLFFEIRETGNETALSALYEAIPAIDRADLKSSIDVEYVAEGETTRGVEAFDVVFRDRMEEPLLVARLDETRSPAPVERVTDLLTAANRVGETVDDLAGAICVSGGYFESDALRTAEEVTDGGFLSRDSKKSFVKRSRRRGYHLCLVEAMGEGFHTSVPEL